MSTCCPFSVLRFDSFIHMETPDAGDPTPSSNLHGHKACGTQVYMQTKYMQLYTHIHKMKWKYKWYTKLKEILLLHVFLKFISWEIVRCILATGETAQLLRAFEPLVEDLGLASNSMWYFMTSCNSDCRESDSLFLFPQALECMESTYIHGNKTLMHIG